MNNDWTEVDELILEIADYKNDFADIATSRPSPVSFPPHR
jgi:hypothetical protein